MRQRIAVVAISVGCLFSALPAEAQDDCGGSNPRWVVVTVVQRALIRFPATEEGTPYDSVPIDPYVLNSTWTDTSPSPIGRQGVQVCKIQSIEAWGEGARLVVPVDIVSQIWTALFISESVDEVCGLS